MSVAAPPPLFRESAKRVYMELSKKDRLILVNQYRILQKLSKEGYEVADYESKITALLNGYTLHYEDLFDEFSENELSVEESRYVLDVLELYRAIIFSYTRLCGENLVTKLTDKDVAFPGFDGNEESEYLSYARYFIEDLGRYDEIKQYAADWDFNSHMNTTHRYKSMLSMIANIEPRYRYCMSEEQIIKLLQL